MTLEVGQAAREMPRYQCHKKVWALKIAAIEFTPDGHATIAPADAGYGVFPTVRPYRAKFHGGAPVNCTKPDFDLGVYVVYEDGYESWSPSKAFEEGYTPLAGVGTTGGV